MTNTTPLSERIHIVISGMRNSGKSSLINNLFGKEVAIVSDTPGTTTDPVTRRMELGKLGPVAITDTAGFDDIGDLGGLRIKKTAERITTANILLFVTRADKEPTDEERDIIKMAVEKKIHILIALTFSDKPLNDVKLSWVGDYEFVKISNLDKSGIEELKDKLISLEKNVDYEIAPLDGLVEKNDLVLLVAPIDAGAPKGRLILPQVETIRDVLDKHCACLVVTEEELKYFYDNLKSKPKLVVTDSQAFAKVAESIPQDQVLTSFSILFARKKGDLSSFIGGLKILDNVKAGSKIMILEACSHKNSIDDIGRIKIPHLFKKIIQPDVEFEFAKNLPDSNELKSYSAVIHCGGCMVTRKKVMSRIEILNQNHIPVMNYGLFLAWVNGLLPRALEPFPKEYNDYISRNG